MEKCEFCEREKQLTFHHYIPKTLHNNKYFKKIFDKDYMRTYGVYLCKDCHKTLHKFFKNKELAKNYNTKEKIFNSDKYMKFIKWIRKQ